MDTAVSDAGFLGTKVINGLAIELNRWGIEDGEERREREKGREREL